MKLGVVIPTLQHRASLLETAIRSALEIKRVTIIVVSPSEPTTHELVKLATFCDWIVSNKSLPDAINLGLMSMPKDVTHLTWLGDDDSLVPEAFWGAVEKSRNHHLVVGWCEYVNENSEVLWTQKPRPWRLKLIPRLFVASPIAQPATVFSREAFLLSGGLNPAYKLAFDQDFFFRLISKHGRPVVIRKTISRYRRHEGTLSSLQWRNQLMESAEIRSCAAPAPIRLLVILTDKVRLMIMLLKSGSQHKGI